MSVIKFPVTEDASHVRDLRTLWIINLPSMGIHVSISEEATSEAREKSMKWIEKSNKLASEKKAKDYEEGINFWP